MALLDHVKYDNGNDTDKRAIAVDVALQLILAKAGSSPDKTETLKRELGNLSEYADQIQDALKVKAE